MITPQQTLNPIQLHLLEMFRHCETDSMIEELKDVLADFYARKVQSEIETQLETLERHDIARASIDANGKIIVAVDLNEALEVANELAPEHLELCVDDPFALLDAVKGLDEGGDPDAG